MRPRAIFFWGSIAIGAILALTRCSNATPRSYGIPCPAIAVVGPTLLSPVPGSTGVSTAAGQIQIATTNGYATSLAVQLTPSSGTALVIGTLTYPSPTPSGSPTPTSFAYPQLAASTTYAVAYRDTTGRACPLAVSSGGSFTTGSN